MEKHEHQGSYNVVSRIITQPSLGIYVFGLSSIAAGIIDFIWKEFEPVHQPVQALGGHIADIKILVYLGVFLLIAGGAAVMWQKMRWIGAAALGVIYGFFGVSTFRRFYTAPHYLGYHFSVYIGVLATTGEQAILVVAAIVVYWSVARGNRFSNKKILFVRWIFGIFVFNFGLAQLMGLHSIASMIPKWIPISRYFWAVFTSIAFIAAGLGLVLKIYDVLAMQLLALMLLIFNFIALAPLMFNSPSSHVSWGVNAYNLTAAAAAWIIANWLTEYRKQISA